MTDIVRDQLKKKVPPQLIKLMAEIRAAGFQNGVTIGQDGSVAPTSKAIKAGPSHKRVLKRNGTLCKWIKALNGRYRGWALFYR